MKDQDLLEKYITDFVNNDVSKKRPSMKYQYTSLEDYKKDAEDIDFYSEMQYKVGNILPLNTWIKVNINGKDMGIMRYEANYGTWRGKGISLKPWRNNMPIPLNILLNQIFLRVTFLDTNFGKYLWLAVLLGIALLFINN